MSLEDVVLHIPGSGDFSGGVTASCDSPPTALYVPLLTHGRGIIIYLSGDNSFFSSTTCDVLYICCPYYILLSSALDNG